MEPLGHSEPHAHEERQETSEDDIAPLPNGFRPENGNAAGADDKDWQYFNLLSLGTAVCISRICPN